MKWRPDKGPRTEQAQVEGAGDLSSLKAVRGDDENFYSKDVHARRGSRPATGEEVPQGR